jgi:nitrogen fixation/metabolism regulation signal transduction histidine kinase
MMSGESEFSRLAEAFNSMSAAIKENQSRLLRAERLAAWREVARRIAHEIRNPLTPIGVELYRLSKMIEEKPGDFAHRASSALDVIKGQMTILQDLALQFSMFAREPELRLEKCSLKDIVSRTLGVFESFENLRLEIDIPDDLPGLYLDPQMMTRVFVNLIKNSAEAAEGTALVSISASLKDNSLAVVIKDNGPGFPQAKLDDIGQPYITSKKTGTGLGLAVAKKIIDEHRGTIKIYNDNGAVVDIRLPLEIPK